ncbi:MAG: formate--tetrahydrofolate ligase [Bacteroidales bacterium]|jgi:formate--tetrahydrofolate ligase|nr:formate--tetrahydrofolate ligase [Bacteroidales bacterium]NLP20852.1 formate--tetrahydrofolate ligase [Bacteroidales bacterium]OQC45271.1 MAG: Formate--tetrahydrofolate ligase [Bacteroidetes bacterium ADurb.Bin028]HNY43695.1 formate--tetrahydrofolate ligase [Bacteroidales bacterium]
MKDIDIAKAAKLELIDEIAAKLGISKDDIEHYGKYKAKLPLHLIDEEKIEKSKLILVTAITPTPAGEGKTTTSIGLAQGMNKIGHKTTVVLREPSLGPVFGVKGGATGGGYAQVVPMEDINLHFTGDLGAIEKANNLLAALIDNNIQSKTRNLGIDPRTIQWKRVMDMNERALRKIVIGLGGQTQGVPRETGFDITAASEIMAILCLSKDLEDLKEKIGNIFVGYTYDKKPIYARDLNAQGAVATLLKDAIKPNLVQTLENTPAIIHGGPFANIAQGTNSLIATKMGLSLSDYVITEAGFASELGAEKFLDIKARYGGLKPDAVVIVATIRALKYHGGVGLKELANPNPEAVKIGLENLDKHIENVQHFKIQPIVALNQFVTDSKAELEVLENHLKAKNVKYALNSSWAHGGDGALDFAKVVVETVNAGKSNFEPLYELDWSMEKKIETIATKLYGASGVEFTAKAKKDLRTIDELGLSKLPVCIAKTQNSLSDDKNLRNRPKDFVVNIREIEIASGAGFVVPISGEIMRMPGLPETPAAEAIDIDNEGNIVGLF